MRVILVANPKGGSGKTTLSTNLAGYLASTGERVAMEPGDKLVIPAGVLHAEGDTPAPVTYIVALPEPRPFGEFLTLLPPESAPTFAG
jgi:hypothetical protein